MSRKLQKVGREIFVSVASVARLIGLPYSNGLSKGVGLPCSRSLSYFITNKYLSLTLMSDHVSIGITLKTVSVSSKLLRHFFIRFVFRTWVVATVFLPKCMTSSSNMTLFTIAMTFSPSCLIDS